MSSTAVRRLTALTEMLQQVQLAALSQAEATRQCTLAAIARLDQPSVDADLDPVTVGLVQISYARWADQRRVELEKTLMRQTVDCDAAQITARTAFGRHQALQNVAARLAAQKTPR